MKCPECHHLLSELSPSCPHCGKEFSLDFRSKLVSFMEIRRELDRLHSIASDELIPGIHRLSSKIEKHYSAAEKPAPAPRPAVATAKPMPEFPPAPAPEARHDKEEESDALGFETAMGQKWLLIIGVVATVFGIGYFLKYSFEQGWVGPAGRVAMAYLWGAAFLFGGEMFRRRGLRTFGLYLSGGGIAALYSATFAAFQVYNLIGQVPAFALMVMVTALAVALSVIYDAKWLAVLGLIGGFLTPSFISTGRDNYIALLGYMTVLNLGLLAVAFYKKWNLLTVLGFFFTYALYAGWYGKYYMPSKFWPALIFVNVFYLIYTVMPFITRFIRGESSEKGGFAVIVPNSFIAFGFSYQMVRAHFSLEAVGVVSVFYAAVFLAMATYVFRTGRQYTEGFGVLVGKAMLFLIITVPLVFSEHWITIFWSAQAAALIWMGMRLNNQLLSRSAVALFMMTAFKLLFLDYPEIFGLSYPRISPQYGYFLLERSMTSAIFLLLLYLSAGMAREQRLSTTESAGELIHPVMYGGAGVLLFVLLNIETSAFFYDALPAARFAAISVLWALFSVGLMAAGFRRFSPELRKTALALFMATILKVFLSDMANVSTPYRIVSFIMLGLLLLGTSYLYHKYKHMLAPGEPEKRRENA